MGDAISGVTVFDFGSGGFPVFGNDGTLQGNLTSSQGQPPTGNALSGIPLPPLPSVGGAAAATGITGGAIPPSSTTGSTTGSTANNWFVRAVIVILGFVFVAVGLSQFGAFGAGIGAGKWYDR